MSAPVRVAAPSTPVVTLSEAKAHLRVDFDDEDATIQTYLDAAIDEFDGYSGVLGRCLITQQWSFTLSAFPAGRRIALPFPGVTAAVITYFDADNAGQTLSASLYSLDEEARSTAVVLDSTATWPATRDRSDAVKITMTAGYGDDAGDVPAMIRHGILILMADLYYRRESGGAGTFTDRVIAKHGRAGIGAAFSQP